jgi:hypothetical protein
MGIASAFSAPALNRRQPVTGRGPEERDPFTRAARCGRCRGAPVAGPARPRGLGRGHLARTGGEEQPEPEAPTGQGPLKMSASSDDNSVAGPGVLESDARPRPGARGAGFLSQAHPAPGGGVAIAPKGLSSCSSRRIQEARWCSISQPVHSCRQCTHRYVTGPRMRPLSGIGARWTIRGTSSRPHSGHR